VEAEVELKMEVELDLEIETGGVIASKLIAFLNKN